jgi:hypothetical protein
MTMADERRLVTVLFAGLVGQGRSERLAGAVAVFESLGAEPYLSRARAVAQP